MSYILKLFYLLKEEEEEEEEVEEVDYYIVREKKIVWNYLKFEVILNNNIKKKSKKELF